MKARILRVLEYEGELQDLMNDSRNWGVKGSHTFGMKGHEILIREACMWPSGAPVAWQVEFKDEKDYD